MNKDNKELRETIINTLFCTGTGHLGGSLSCVDFVYQVYKDLMPRLKVVMSKGHASLALYASIEKTLKGKSEILTEYGKARNGKYHGHISKKVDETIAGIISNIENGLKIPPVKYKRIANWNKS